MVNVSVVWKEHFINKIHHEGNLLAEIEKYPTQFQELEDDGILMAKKYNAHIIIIYSILNIQPLLKIFICLSMIAKCT